MSMHQDPDLQARSALTGSRGARLLKVLADLNPEVETNCQAIFAVARNDSTAAAGSGSDSDSSGRVDAKLLKVCNVQYVEEYVCYAQFHRNVLFV
jgi:hypothetical protein